MTAASLLRKSFLITITLFIATSLRAQTAKASAEWLEAKLKAYAAPEVDRPQFLSVRVDRLREAFRKRTFADGRVEEVTHANISFANIRAVSVVRRAQSLYSNGLKTGSVDVYQISVKGAGAIYDANNDLVESTDDWDICLSAETPSPEVDRIIKAIRHLSDLNGAKLIDEDLFK